MTAVASVDFGTPVSRSPRIWGAVAAQNALSDIYATGGRPLFALSILGWPAAAPADPIEAIMKGALEILGASGGVLLGGHSMSADIPLFGLAVVGTPIRPGAVLRGRCRPGQVLLLSKPIGTGIVIAGARAGVATDDLVASCERVMLGSNRPVAEAAATAGVRAATDVSGYRLLGHLQLMLQWSGCAAQVDLSRVPTLPGAVDLLTEHALVPNSAERTYLTLKERTAWSGLPYEYRVLLYDPQTSGGLLLSVDRERLDGLRAECARRGHHVDVIGDVVAGDAGFVEVFSSASPGPGIPGRPLG